MGVCCQQSLDVVADKMYVYKCTLFVKRLAVAISKPGREALKERSHYCVHCKQHLYLWVISSPIGSWRLAVSEMGIPTVHQVYTLIPTITPHAAAAAALMAEFLQQQQLA